jgi:hypothetical protein
VCVDATHNTTDKDLKLIAVIVIDDAGFIFPAAFCLAKEEEEGRMAAMWSELVKRIPRASADQITTLMSDDHNAGSQTGSRYPC